MRMEKDEGRGARGRRDARRSKKKTTTKGRERLGYLANLVTEKGEEARSRLYTRFKKKKKNEDRV